MARISVVVPTYNRAATLGRALDSIAAQSRPAHEIIVVDDGSSDGTPEVVARFSGVKLLRLPTNLGAAHARNAGVREASGEWVAFLDSDDVWAVHKLQRQLEHIHARPDLDLSITGIVVRPVGGRCVYHGFPSPRPAHEWTFNELQSYSFAPSTWLLRRQAFLDLGMFDEGLSNCEDLEALARMIRQLSIEAIDEPLVLKYNQRDSLDADVERTAASFKVLFERHRDLWQRAPEAAARSYRRLATMHARAGQWPEVRAALRSSLDYRPLNPGSWSLLMASTLGRRAYLRLSRALAVPA